MLSGRRRRMTDPQPDLRVLFCEALDRQTLEEQSHFLDESCRDRPELRARVEALLRAHREAGSFLKEVPQALADTCEGPGSQSVLEGLENQALVAPVVERPGMV